MINLNQNMISMDNSLNKKLLLITFFGIAMAMLESAVVVYLRELYYPNGFTVTLMDMPQRIIVVELFRELATLIMLLTIGWLVGRTKSERFAWFIYTFAVWDIFYYVWLKVFIDWPISILDWDILFLLPITWLGPVLAPVICSITMIVFAILILLGESKRIKMNLDKFSWTLIILGAVAIFGTFIKDYTEIVIEQGFYKDFAHILQNPAFIEITKTYIPETFAWGWFLFGQLLILSGIGKSLIHRK